MLAGDWHGNLLFVQKLYGKLIKELEVDTVIQLGDFGYWEHKKEGPLFLDGVSKVSQEYGVDTYWIDGNHENHEKLREDYIKDDPNRFVQIRDNLYHIPRGHTWTWDEITFMGFGGAYSIDKRFRSPFIDWWPDESPNEDEVQRAMTKGKVDVLLTHDVPAGVDVFAHAPFPLLPFPEAMVPRNCLRRVADATQPSKIFHGHYHFPYRTEWKAPWGIVEVRGLDADYTASHWRDVYSIIDTKEPIVPWVETV